MHHDDETMPTSATGRRAVVAGLAGAASVAALGGMVSASGSVAGPGAGPDRDRAAARPRMPTVYLPHGGGPWPFVDLGLPVAETEPMAAYLRGLRDLPAERPQALLVISAHWEAPVATVMTAEHPAMLYDYYGFPPEAYHLRWPAPGAPALAGRVRALLDGAGIMSADDGERGFDHGTFVPLMLSHPDADVPTLQLSLVRGLDPAAHLAIGRALAPLRDEGVFILGSGMSYHNMRGFGDPRQRGHAEAFDAWLRETTGAPREQRDERLLHWSGAPSARHSHPREEHLLPLMVVAGAAGDDVGSVDFSGTVMGLRVSAHRFG